MTRAGRAELVAALVSIAACGHNVTRPGAENAHGAAVAGARDLRVAKDRPPLAIVLRDGDPRGAIGAAVTTEGIAPDRGAEVALALAGLIEARLDARGVRDVAVVGGWDGYRVRALATGDASGAAIVEAIRRAMLAPVDADGLLAARRKLAALAKRPMADVAMLDAVRCTGEPFAIPRKRAASEELALTVDELEAWRRAAHGLGRVAFAIAGSDALAEAAGAAIARGEVWPRATPIAATPPPAPDARAEVYDASGSIAPGSARLTIAVHTPSPAQALAMAQVLGDNHGPLASRLGALDAPGKIRAVTAAAHPAGGCLALTIDLGARDLKTDAPGRIATAAALARQELAVELGEQGAPADGGDANIAGLLALGTGDPREAAERAAWWTLTGSRTGDIRFTVTIGVASGKDGGVTVDSPAAAIRSDLDRATVAWHSPVVEARSRVERGQGELWLLFGSTCGTLPEIDGDAGLGAAVALATAEQAARRGSALAEVEPWITPDGIGVLAHGPAAPGESPAAHARRLADLAARTFGADSLDPGLVAQARALLLGRASEQDGRALATLAGAMTPGHASWLAPLGTMDGLGRSSDAAVLLRASAMRAGPLRVAVVANADALQSQAAVRAVDRWIARRPGEVRACPFGAPAVAKPGTYAVETTSSAAAEAWLAVALPPNDDAARASATWLAAALDGDDGLLSKALRDANLARRWSARVVGPPRSAALVVRVASPHASLDAAVAQARALLDRLRQGALTEADRARAVAAREHDALAESLDPRARLIGLWRDGARDGARDSARAAAPEPPPSLDALRAFAAKTLRDDALVIVAARPPRARP